MGLLRRHGRPVERLHYSLRAPLAFVVLLAALSTAAAWQARDLAVGLISVTLLTAATARLMSAPPPATRSRRLHGVAMASLNAAIALTALGAAIGAAEGAVRWLYRDVTSTADFRGYFTTRWLRRDVRHNHYDYRGPEFADDTPPGIYRVAVMGDSFTYGNGVHEAQRFSNLVGEAVRDRGIEVLNFGFPGNNWKEHVATLERRVLRLRPDFVLLQWGINDVELDEHVAGRPSVPPLVTNRDWHEWLHETSALYTMLNAQWVRLRVRRAMEGDTYDRYLTRLYGDPSSGGARQAETLMRRFLALCRERHAAVGVVLFPDAAVSLGPDYPYQFLHDRVAAICADAAVPCVDLLPDYRRVPDRFALWVTPLDAHPSALANRIAADAVLATFAPHWGHAARASAP